MEEVVKAAETFDTDVYSNLKEQEDRRGEKKAMHLEVANVTMGKVKSPSGWMSRRDAGENDGLTVELTKVTENFENFNHLHRLYTKCLQQQA